MPPSQLQTALGAEHVAVLPNGAHSTVNALHLNGSWASQLRNLEPSASRIGLWSSEGTEVLWMRRDGTSGVSARCTAPCGPLYAVRDGSHFVWPPGGHAKQKIIVENAAYTLRTLSVRPHVLLAERLLTRAELRAIRRMAAPRLHRSQTDFSLLQTLRRFFLPNERAYRSSSNAWLPIDMRGTAGSDEALVSAAIRRISSLLRIGPSHSEPMQVVHYNMSEYYFYHLDNGELTPRDPRTVTALFYLNDGFGGGHTNFPLAEPHAEPSARAGDILRRFGPCQTTHGLSVKPRVGDVLLFYNTQPNSLTNDFWPWHASCEITSGEKWAANLWFHAQRHRSMLKHRPQQQ